MLKELLNTKKCFKLVCGAGNEDANEVEKLVALYSSAGCKFFDLSAKPQIVDSAKRGLNGREDFLRNEHVFNEALKIAKWLIEKV